MGIMNYARGEKLLETMVLREDLNLKRELNELTVYTTSRTAADKPSTTGCCPKLRMYVDGRDGLCAMRTEPSPRRAHRPWDNTPG
jgi:hypothetical protein